MKKRTAFLLGAGALVGTVGGLTNYFFNYIFGRVDDAEKNWAPVPSQGPMHDQVNSFREERLADMKWFDSASPETVYIKSFDGLQLAAELLEHEDPAGICILSHTYRGMPQTDVSSVARYFYGKGYTVLTPYHRAHGKSEGKYITFGIHECDDLVDWIYYMDRRSKGRLPVVLYGVSMGSTTVLNTLGEELPQSVKCAVADCGITSLYDILKYIAKKDFYIYSDFPLFYTVDALAKRKAGFSFKDRNTLDALSRNELPVLFVHGDSDRFVPTSMTYENYDFCHSEKDILIVQGASHAMSYLVSRAAYQAKLDDFLGRCGLD